MEARFTMYRDLPPAVGAAGELEDQEPTEVTYVASWRVVPAEGDGYNGPHIPAYPVVESVVDALGNDMGDDREVLEAANNAMYTAFVLGADDEFDPFDD